MEILIYVIRFKLQELMAEKQFREGKKITVKEISEATGINRATLSKMLNTKGHNTVTDNLDALCKFFGCEIQDVAVYVPDQTESN